jgi:hypothetical protein
VFWIKTFGDESKRPIVQRTSQSIQRLAKHSFFVHFLECLGCLCICRSFIYLFIFEGCLKSNSVCCRSKRARYQLCHPSSYISSNLAVGLIIQGPTVYEALFGDDLSVQALLNTLLKSGLRPNLPCKRTAGAYLWWVHKWQPSQLFTSLSRCTLTVHTMVIVGSKLPHIMYTVLPALCARLMGGIQQREKLIYNQF